MSETTQDKPAEAPEDLTEPAAAEAERQDGDVGEDDDEEDEPGAPA